MTGTCWHIVTGDFAPTYTGGVACWSLQVALALQDCGRQVLVYARGAHGAGRLRELSYDAQASVEILRVRGHGWAQHQAEYARQALRGQLRPGDTVLATTWPIAAQLPALCRETGAALGVVAQGSELSRLMRETPSALQELASSARFFAVSSFLVQLCEERGFPAELLPAPVSPQVMREGQGAGLLTVARLGPLKGVDRVIALGQALAWPVTIIGEGPCRAELEDLAESLGVDATFTGRLPHEEVEAWYPRARLFALLSRADEIGLGAEGFGLVVLEAAAHGVPAVVSGCGGLPQAVGPGLVLPNPDEPERSAERIGRWWNAGRGAEAFEHLREHHGPERTAQALIRALEEKKT